MLRVHLAAVVATLGSGAVVDGEVRKKEGKEERKIVVESEADPLIFSFSVMLLTVTLLSLRTENSSVSIGSLIRVAPGGLGVPHRESYRKIFAVA